MSQPNPDRPSRQEHAALSLHVPFPSSPQVTARTAMALVKKFGGEDAIGPEVPKRLTQLAPGREQPHRLGVTDDHRPDCAFTLLRLLVSIADPYLAPTADPQAGPRNIQAVRGQHIAWRRANSRLSDERRQTFGQGRGNLGDQVAPRAGQHRVPPARLPIGRQAPRHRSHPA